MTIVDIKQMNLGSYTQFTSITTSVLIVISLYISILTIIQAVLGGLGDTKS